MKGTRVLAVAVLLLGACGTTAEPSATTAEPEPSTTSSAVTTTTSTTVPATTTTTVPPTTTTTAPTPSALDSLEPFFEAAEELDSLIAAAAKVFNAGFDEDAGTVSQESIDAIGALSTETLAATIPAGMPEDLDTAVLAVYTDLESRIASLDGGVRYLDPVEARPDQVEWALLCLGYGSDSKDRYETDLETAKTLASTYPPVTPAAPDSVEAGMLTLKLVVIGSFNWGCDSCGGAIWDGSLPIDWEGRTVADGVGFEATFNGTEWEVLVYAC